MNICMYSTCTDNKHVCVESLVSYFFELCLVLGWLLLRIVFSPWSVTLRIYLRLHLVLLAYYADLFILILMLVCSLCLFILSLIPKSDTTIQIARVCMK